MTFQDNLVLSDLSSAHVIHFKNLAAARISSHPNINYELRALISKTQNFSRIIFEREGWKKKMKREPEGDKRCLWIIEIWFIQITITSLYYSVFPVVWQALGTPHLSDVLPNYHAILAGNHRAANPLESASQGLWTSYIFIACLHKLK